MTISRGTFVVLEGLDGCGKTTQIELLEESLQEKGYRIRVVEEPGGTPIGGEIRDLLLDPKQRDLRPLTELFLYEASRTQLVEDIIRPELEAGTVVMADRFSLSSVAYQGYGRGIDLDLVRDLNRAAQQGIEPDLTVLLDISVEEFFRRKKGQPPDRIESESTDFYRRVTRGFKEVASEKERHIILDGTEPREKIRRKILEAVLDLLARKR